MRHLNLEPFNLTLILTESRESMAGINKVSKKPRYEKVMYGKIMYDAYDKVVWYKLSICVCLFLYIN